MASIPNDQAVLLVPEPSCGVCSAGALLPLPRDRCGLCNGDGGGCGCDGAGGSTDACGTCVPAGGAPSGDCVEIANPLQPASLAMMSAGSALAAVCVLGVLLCRRMIRSLAQLARAAPTEPARPSDGGAALGDRSSRGDGVDKNAGGWLHQAQAALFMRMGRSVAARPLLVAGCCLAGCSIAGSGIALTEIEDSPLRLWLPRNSLSASNEARLAAVTQRLAPRAVAVLLNAAEVSGGGVEDGGGSGVPLRTALRSALAWHHALAALQVPIGDESSDQGGEEGGGLRSLERLVLDGQEGMQSVLLLWGYDTAVLEEDPQPHVTLAEALAMPAWGPLLHDTVAFASGVEQPPGEEARVTSLMLRYMLRRGGSDGVAAERLESAMATLLHGSGGSAGQAAVADGDEDLAAVARAAMVPWLFSETSLEEELQRSIDDDILLIMVGYSLMSVYLSLAISSQPLHLLRSRGPLAVAALVSVGLATLAAFGACAVAGVTFNSTVNIVTFIMLGVGVDDALLLVGALDAASARDELGQSSPGMQAVGTDGARRTSAVPLATATRSDPAERLVTSRRGLPPPEVTPAPELLEAFELTETKETREAIGSDSTARRAPLPVHSDEDEGDEQEEQQRFARWRLAAPRGRQAPSAAVVAGPPCDAAEEMVAAAVADVGASILLSSATNAVTFALGAATDLPGLRSFCIYACVGMLTDLACQLTFFVAAMALDERRRASRRCAFCPLLQLQPAEAATPPDAHISIDLGICRLGCLGPRARPASAAVAPPPRPRQLLHSRCGYLVLSLYCALTLGAAAASAHVRVGLQVHELVPVGSYVAEHWRLLELAWPQRISQLELIVTHRATRELPPDFDAANTPRGWALQAAPLSDAATAQHMRWLGAAVEAAAAEGDAEVLPASALWWESFAEHRRLRGLAPASGDGGVPVAGEEASAFLTRMEVDDALRRDLAAWRRGVDAADLIGNHSLLLGGGGSRGDDDDDDDDDDVVVATRRLVLVRRYGAQQMLAVRRAVETSPLSDAAVVASAVDVYLEQDAVMVQTASRSLAMVFAAVVVVVALLTLRPLFVLAMAAVVASCGVHMLGWMCLTRTPLNFVSLIPLLLSLGLCIDYCTHIAHAAWTVHGAPADRAAAALASRGGAVASAGLSTLLATSMMGCAASMIMVTFFKMFAGVVVVGLAHALLVLPICLSLAPFADPGGERFGAEGRV